MLLDYVTLMVAIGISAACLSMMVFAAWLIAPKDSFLLIFAIGSGLCATGTLLYGLYIADPRILHGVAAFAALLCGLSTLVGAGYQFRTARSPLRLIVYLALITNAVALPALAAGYSGIGLVPIDVMIAALLFASAGQYWGARATAPAAIAALCGLYSLIGISMLVRASVLVRDGRLVLDGAPNNWAEQLALMVLVACVPALSAVTLALNQMRLAQIHREAAMTDPLTGLLNRRALMEAFRDGLLPERSAVLAFDIDRFKSINDQHGHSTGDRVILAFARAMADAAKANGFAARLGGDEFALVIPAASAESALRLAEEIRAAFRQYAELLGVAGLNCSVSAGIAFGGTHGINVESVLNEADTALYAAKNGGRDRAFSAEPRLAL